MRFQFICAIFALGLISAPHAWAQNVSIVPQAGSATTYQAEQNALRLTPDKSELVRLPRNAGSVLVGNPAHISVLAESARTLVIVPKAAGASHFTVLDESGDIIMRRHVIVASPSKNYIRIRRTCTGGDEACQDTSVYYCPGMCHEINMQSAEASVPVAQEEVAQNASSNAAYATPPEADSN